jgi:hypothetical protein
MHFALISGVASFAARHAGVCCAWIVWSAAWVGRCTAEILLTFR